MVLFFLDSMVCCDHSSSIWQKANRNQRLIESGDRLRFIVNNEDLGNIEIVKYKSLVVNKHDREMAIVLVCDTKDSTFISLLDATHFDVGAFKISREYLFHGNDVESLKDKLLISAASDSDGMF